mgnify:CR=1 FL=1
MSAHTNECGFTGWVARYEERVFKKITYFSPDKLIILNISPENSVLRKPKDLTLEQAKTHSKMMIDFNWRAFGDTVIIDANKPQDRVLLSLVEEVWEVLKN